MPLDLTETIQEVINLTGGALLKNKKKRLSGGGSCHPLDIA